MTDLCGYLQNGYCKNPCRNNKKKEMRHFDNINVCNIISLNYKYKLNVLISCIGYV